MEIGIVLMLLVMAWFHARLTVVNQIVHTATCVHMLNGMVTNTMWWSMLIIIVYFTFSWGFWVLWFCTLRFAFLIRINWNWVCDQHAAIKQLVDRK